MRFNLHTILWLCIGKSCYSDKKSLPNYNDIQLLPCYQENLISLHDYVIIHLINWLKMKYEIMVINKEKMNSLSTLHQTVVWSADRTQTRRPTGIKTIFSIQKQVITESHKTKNAKDMHDHRPQKHKKMPYESPYFLVIRMSPILYPIISKNIFYITIKTF